MAVNGTPLRQKFLIRGVVRHVLQDANDVNLVNGARVGSRDDFQLERLWPSHHFFSEEKRRRPVNYRMASYGYMPLKFCWGHLCCPELPCGTGQVLIFWACPAWYKRIAVSQDFPSRLGCRKIWTCFWLVVYLPLWKIWVCQLGWWNSQ